MKKTGVPTFDELMGPRVEALKRLERERLHYGAVALRRKPLSRDPQRETQALMPIDVHAHYVAPKILDVLESEGDRYGVHVAHTSLPARNACASSTGCRSGRS